MPPYFQVVKKWNIGLIWVNVFKEMKSKINIGVETANLELIELTLCIEKNTR